MRCAACGFENGPGAQRCGDCDRALTAGELQPRAYTPRHLADRILTTRSAIQGERKQVTVLFADVVGSVALSDRVDPEHWHWILDRFFAIGAEAVHRFEGTVNQYTGDGFMALFGAPIALEDHAARACRTSLFLRTELARYALRLRREEGLDFGVRLGLNSGEVVVGKIGDDLRMDYTAQGHAVGLAARMAQVAQPGQVAATPATVELAEGLFSFDEIGPREVKGATGAVLVRNLVGTGPRRSRLDLSRERGLTPFVGRESEIQALLSARTRAFEGTGQVVGVAGEPGAGKSRLCLEFIESCRADGIPVFESHCVAHGRTVPYFPWQQLLRSFFAIEDGDDDDAVRAKLSAGTDHAGGPEDIGTVYELLGLADAATPTTPRRSEDRRQSLGRFLEDHLGERAAAEPLVIVLDDLHWIDPESEAVLREWVASLRRSRVLLVVNFRPGFAADWMKSSHYRPLFLYPLPAAALQLFLQNLISGAPEVASLCNRVAGETGGNPLFMEEIVRSLVQGGTLAGEPGAYTVTGPTDTLDIPASVESIVASRIDGLGEREKGLVQLAATIGRRFRQDVLEHASQLGSDELRISLEALQDAELLRGAADDPTPEWAFVHPITQEVAYRAQLRDARERRHARVAAAIEATADRLGEQAALLATHWELAGKDWEARRWRQFAALRVTNIQPRRPR